MKGLKNNKLVQGMALGALVGGLLALLDRDTRNDVWNKVKTTQASTRYYAKNPSEGFQSLREGYINISSNISNGVTGALDILAKIQETLDSVSKLDDGDIQLNVKLSSDSDDNK
ncbi:hypothetical protein [Aquibacillus kalidii]|uniref:hypothetical protein n=1 Tax=Aquibacillus kalidii TaxID=2762597 RepID=UPI001C99DE55|nr:hypothetical protein [Aquibacillus kalidii]